MSFNLFHIKLGCYYQTRLSELLNEMLIFFWGLQTTQGLGHIKHMFSHQSLCFDLLCVFLNMFSLRSLSWPCICNPIALDSQILRQWYKYRRKYRKEHIPAHLSIHFNWFLTITVLFNNKECGLRCTIKINVILK